MEVSGQRLIIKAEKKEESKKTGDGGVDEPSSRSFHRSVMLPDGIKTDGIEAKYHNGVLEVHMPKTEEAKPKRISVQG